MKYVVNKEKWIKCIVWTQLIYIYIVYIKTQADNTYIITDNIVDKCAYIYQILLTIYILSLCNFTAQLRENKGIKKHIS